MAVLFVLTASLVLLALNVDQQLLHSDIYKRALAEQQIYERLPALAGEQLGTGIAFNPCAEDPERTECKLEGDADVHTSPLAPVFTDGSPELQACVRQAIGAEVFETLAASKRLPKNAEFLKIRTCLRQYSLPEGTHVGAEGAPQYTAMLDQADWTKILATLLPADWLQTQTESALDQLFEFLELKGDQIKISLVEFKARLMGEAGRSILLQIVRAQPPCRTAQLAVWQPPISSDALNKLLDCRPPEEILKARAAEIQTSAAKAIGGIPDEIDLAQGLRGENQSTAQTGEQEEPRVALSRLRFLIRLTPLVPFVLLLLIALFAVRSRSALARWWGIPLLIVGVLVGIIALTILFGAEWGMQTFMPMEKASAYGVTANLLQTAVDLGNSVARMFATWLGLEAALIALVGVVLLVWGRRAREKGQSMAKLVP
ncbi:MAG: hypothetical protein HY780_12735 [Chloroflexi bacterium]|nr:hypothetical protein [Chloroflexota bacterium]